MTEDDHWNQESAWAEPSRPQDQSLGTEEDGAGSDWAEDLRTGAAWSMQAHASTDPQSGLGIASLVMSLLAGLMMAIPLGIGVALAAQNPNLPEDSPQLLGVVCVMFLGVLLAVLSGIVGLIALFQPQRAKTCAVLGLTLAAIEVGGFAGLFVLGLLVG